MNIDMGPYYCANPHHALLHHVINEVVGFWPRPCGPSQPNGHGVALEFGVGEGASLRCIASRLPVIGFDSFEGLPEDWREGFPLGTFATYRKPGDLPANAAIVEGLFEDVLPTYGWEGAHPVRLVHIDCDLYSSTKTVLDNLPWENMVANKACIVFDEFWGYDGAEQHEQRAWEELISKQAFAELQWTVIGHGVQQLAIQLV